MLWGQIKQAITLILIKVQADTLVGWTYFAVTLDSCIALNV